jgi:hypothetical protein
MEWLFLFQCDRLKTMLSVLKDGVEWALAVVCGALVFFCAGALLAFALYLVGTWRGFAEGTQLALLEVVFGASIVLALLLAALFAGGIALSRLRGGRVRVRVRRALVGALLGVLSLALLCASGAILVLTGGNAV